MNAKNSARWSLLCGLVLVSLLFSACNSWGAAGHATQTAVSLTQTETARPTNTPTSTATPTQTPTPTATPTATPTPTPTPVVYGPTGFPDNVNPLTGLVVSDPELLNRRPMFIKVANFPRTGRPHAGLSYADLVFEYYIGEGANRFAAVYYGQDCPQVGPMRSGRLVDAQLAPMYQGTLAYVSAWDWVRTKLDQTMQWRGMLEGPNTCPAICRLPPGDVTSVFADTAALEEAFAKRNVQIEDPVLDGMYFNEAVPANGIPGEKLRVEFYIKNIGEWVYDPVSGKYLRWIETVDVVTGEVNGMIPLVDRLTDEQLGFSNVVLIFATYTTYSPTIHDMTILDNRDGMRAVLFRDGQAFETVWKSVGYDKPIQFFTPEGDPMAFKPGNTWFVIMGRNSPYTETEPGKWLVQLSLR
ncbi:MAG TPA: DUF3048 domain-containing protein [Anaerolineaceae bacterium]|nr:DUF3048 domain-containing protein [Longilinea sp.]HOG79026.1 DUF3048 domain-containing protein [Anaerolineaceae bacterium]